MKSVFLNVETVLKESVGLKVMTFDELRSKLLEKDKDFSSVSDKAVAQLLKWLRIEVSDSFTPLDLKLSCMFKRLKN